MSAGDLSEAGRQEAMARFQVLRPHLEDGVPLLRAAREAGVAPRTAQRWLARYRDHGLSGLARTTRSDQGTRRLPGDLVKLIEALALQRPRPSVATIARRVEPVARENGWPVPSYSRVYAIVAGIDPHLSTLAHEGPTGLRDRFELVYRRQAEHPNDMWQADHTELDILVLDADGRPVRPWLTVILDDCSRAVAGYSLFPGAPSALNLSLALRQAIWVKPDPAWAVHGLPDVLYVDHGSDFISKHIAAVAADLHIQLVHSAVARPQGRGKVERFIGTITTSLLPQLPGHLVRGHPHPAPRLSLPQLDAALASWITGTYHQQPHTETGVAPQLAWLNGGTTGRQHDGHGQGWLPRTPDSLEDLDLLLVMVAASRRVHRDGIRFEGLRYLDPTLAAYVGQDVTIRYDPRDLGEIRVFHHDRFLCRAISPEYAGTPITLKDIQAARTAHRRALRARLDQSRSTIGEYLPRHPGNKPGADPGDEPPPAPTSTTAASKSRLHAYFEDSEDSADPEDPDDQLGDREGPLP